MKKIIEKQQNQWSDKAFLISFLTGSLLLSLSLIVDNFATKYATAEASNPVADIFLSNLPVVNVNIIVNEGAILFIIFIVIFLLFKPEKFPFTLKSVAIFVLIRSLFITMTHLGPFPQHSYLEIDRASQMLTLGNDLFFSGHVGLPYLLALIFWEEKAIRYICLSASAIFGVSVILGHLHYSIDVFSAFFITYTIYVISQKVFLRDYQLCNFIPVKNEQFTARKN
jgi:membrane-associated phospholipid phosphatase